MFSVLNKPKFNENRSNYFLFIISTLNKYVCVCKNVIRSKNQPIKQSKPNTLLLQKRIYMKKKSNE